MKYIRKILRPFYKFYKRQYGILRLKVGSNKNQVKIVIGASGIFEKGWVPTDIDYLNLLKKEDWNRFFKENSIDTILAEHVWEHLTLEEAKVATANCFKYLKPGGCLRVAVPDGNHADMNYIEMVKPGGFGDGSDDHKMLYTITTITELFSGIGFNVKGLEYFDEHKNFIYNEWDPLQGKINRSKRFDFRNTKDKLIYTSLIIDAIKP